MRLTLWQDQCSESVETEAGFRWAEKQMRSNGVEVVANGVDNSFKGL